MESQFTGNPDTDLLILLLVPWTSLNRICRSSRYLNSICESENFWRQKLAHDFGPESLQYKRPDVTFREQYANLVTSLHPRQDLVRKFISWLFPTLEEKRKVDIANQAASKGDLNVLIHLEREGVLPDQEGATLAALHNHARVVNWLISRNIWPSSFQMIKCGRLDILRYLAEKGIQLSSLDADAAILYRREDILQWLEEIGILPDVMGANLAEKYGDHHIVQRLAQRGILPDPDMGTPEFVIGSMTTYDCS